MKYANKVNIFKYKIKIKLTEFIFDTDKCIKITTSTVLMRAM